MASLTITVGALTSSINAGNTNAARVLANFAEATGYSGPDDNQAKLDHVTRRIVVYLTEVSKAYEARQAATQARDEALADAGNEFK